VRGGLELDGSRSAAKTSSGKKSKPVMRGGR
jgi:hypothetical protein